VKLIVADTGPILHLKEAGALYLLPLIGSVFVPAIVVSELQLHDSDFADNKLPDWLQRIDLSEAAAQRSVEWQQSGILDRGEAESLSAALDMRPDWFLTDDAAARVMAESLSQETHGSLGVVLWAATTKQISKSEGELLLDGLEKSSLWLSSKVRAEARRLLER
jgi:predicted nucleic acid-binding protein